MNVLVLVADYPNNCGNKSLMYVHVRNKYYQKNGINVTVLNFKTKEQYSFEGVSVISFNEYKKRIKYFEGNILICHAPNLKNHYLFMKKYLDLFNHVIFFFHGHEVLDINKEYPKPYSFNRKNECLRVVVQKLYDSFKLFIWHNYFKKIENKSDLVFVSNTLFSKFKKYCHLKDIKNWHIINNAVGECFELNNYRPVKEQYDYITIRSNLDSPTYCVDILCKVCEKLPNSKFLLIGKGKYFKYNEKPSNLKLVDTLLLHEELMDYINSSKKALMLTRNDTQGVMSCELCTYGIPLITSNIPVCKEIFANFNNVILIDNNDLDVDKIENFENLSSTKNETYFSKNTMVKEVELIRNIFNKKRRT